MILNIIWILCGGISTAIAWLAASLIMFITIIGIPWGRATFNIALMAFLPFGSEAVDRRVMTGESDIGTGFLGGIGNVIWFLLAGWWLFLYHVGMMLLMFVTIIGIPFGVQYWKLAKLSLAPIGKAVVWK